MIKCTSDLASVNFFCQSTACVWNLWLSKFWEVSLKRFFLRYKYCNVSIYRNFAYFSKQPKIQYIQDQKLFVKAKKICRSAFIINTCWEFTDATTVNVNKILGNKNSSIVFPLFSCSILLSSLTVKIFVFSSSRVAKKKFCQNTFFTES